MFGGFDLGGVLSILGGIALPLKDQVHSLFLDLFLSWDAKVASVRSGTFHWLQLVGCLGYK